MPAQVVLFHNGVDRRHLACIRLDFFHCLRVCLQHRRIVGGIFVHQVGQVHKDTVFNRLIAAALIPLHAAHHHVGVFTGGEHQVELFLLLTLGRCDELNVNVGQFFQLFKGAAAVVVAHHLGCVQVELSPHGKRDFFFQREYDLFRRFLSRGSLAGGAGRRGRCGAASRKTGGDHTKRQHCR